MKYFETFIFLFLFFLWYEISFEPVFNGVNRKNMPEV